MPLCGCWNLFKKNYQDSKTSEKLEPVRDNQEQQLQNKKTPSIPSSNVPQKKVSFSWNANQSSNRPSHKDSYDYIDAEVDDDDNGKSIQNLHEKNDEDEDTECYSKLDDNHSQHRYDYPTFNLVVTKQERLMIRRNAEESFYASASQTYSLGSEDPYSSIVSIGVADRLAGDESSSTYDPGYSRITCDRQQSKNICKTINSDNKSNVLDDLYAKINRDPSVHKFDPNQASTSHQVDANALNSTRRNYRLYAAPAVYEINEEMESGSGSMASSQPSYRYLSVRESADIVRERIRRREQEEDIAGTVTENANTLRHNDRILPTFPTNILNTVPTEHYYSEINEYESVGGDSIYYNSRIATLDNQRSSNDQENNNNNNQLTNDHTKPSTSSSYAHNNNASIQTDCSTSTLSDTLRIMLSPNQSSSEPPRPPTSPIPKPQPQQPTISQPPPIPTFRCPVIMSQPQVATTHKNAQQQHEQILANRMSIPPTNRPKNSTTNVGKRGNPTHKNTSATTSTIAAPLPPQVGHDYVSSIDLSNQRAWPLLQKQKQQ